ncbi:MAG: pyridoxal-phosphate dependent enzyme, partial [Proteobacteria bacterium]|nr:pyridoxal-phosphate dependent enzyme [Pseudomonadota bacterium]
MNIDIESIRLAAGRLKGVTVHTPMLHSAVLNERLGGEVYVKPECLQHIGAFKFRGAYNRLSQLTEEERARGVVAFSS